MIRSKTALLATGTLFCALATGYVMQYGLTLPGEDMTPRGPVVVTGIVDTAARTDGPGAGVAPTGAPGPATVDPAPAAIADLPAEARAPALPETPHHLAALDAAPELNALPREAESPSFDCEVTLEATPIAGALVRLQLASPCRNGTRVSLHHSGLMITETTDEDGALTIDMPALTGNAVFIASFDDGGGAVAQASVSSLPFYDRVVLQWQDRSALELHAREWGADYFGDGHVWHDAAGTLEEAVRGQGGFLLRLGDASLPDPRLAEVYSYPAGTSVRDGEIAVSVEAEVTEMNCGADIAAQTLDTRAGAELAVRDLTLAMPDCEAVGDYLVLKNLIEDLKIASN
ncbi:translocase [Roseivivax sediminis]|uniref:Translocase n=1 Tax=Roseivivax sediminis TaxID=936889 RepID=A0A1I1U716_9RHOB|nr:translocase [Roseivivax sediminis]SFD66445.1 hypothetical protein SAMN04515678_102182 [Roseivivax sediminis]